MLIPVLSKDNKPLMSCSPRRARELMAKGKAEPYWQKHFFAIRLKQKESTQGDDYPAIALGIDPGSKREGYTVACKKGVILNITTDTADWVKKRVEARRNLRRARRFRTTPYRKCRSNRGCLKRSGRIPPSTRSRWLRKLNMIKFLQKILPITVVNVEDIKANSRKGKRRWNKSFSPLQVGKKWFYREIESFGVKLIKTPGYITEKVRDARGFTKSKDKLDYSWNVHNVDSHVLCEIALKRDIKPLYSLYQLNYIKLLRRQLHLMKPSKGNKRRRQGGTVSEGRRRGTVFWYDGKLGCLGGQSKKGRVSLQGIVGGGRLDQFIKVKEIRWLYNSSWKINYLLESRREWKCTKYIY